MRKHIIMKRFAALGIDYLMILAWMAVHGLVSSGIFLFMFDGYPDFLGILGPYFTQLLFFSLLTLPVGMYFYITEAGRHSATAGKRKLGIAVSATNGKLTKKHVAVRTVIKLLPWEIAHMFIWQLQYGFYVSGYEAPVPTWILAGLIISNILPVIYIAFVFARKDNRSVHDIISRTVVVYS